MEREYARQFFENYPNIKFMRTDGRTWRS